MVSMNLLIEQPSLQLQQDNNFQHVGPLLMQGIYFKMPFIQLGRQGHVSDSTREGCDLSPSSDKNQKFKGKLIFVTKVPIL